MSSTEPLDPAPATTDHGVDLILIGRQFQIDGEFVEGTVFGTGHIHDTFLVAYRDGDQTRRYIHQRVNEHVFHDAERLMENVERITSHLTRKAQEEHPGDERRSLRLIPTVVGTSSWRQEPGQLWRTYNYVEGTVSHDEVQSPEEAYQAALSFGRFQAQLLDLPAPRLHDTIPDFHHTPRRFQTFLDAVAADPAGRVAGADREIQFTIDHEELCHALIGRLEAGELVERVTHNDTKINNVLLDVESGEGLCVIDLDTVMPGLVHYDFGDLVRTAASTAAEDETDLSLVDVNPELFGALARGYLDGAAAFLTDTERRTLPVAGPLITFETGLRFLTDHLQGDPYFKVHRPGHNLDRARAQFRLLERMEERAEELKRLLT